MSTHEVRKARVLRTSSFGDGAISRPIAQQQKSIADSFFQALTVIPQSPLFQRTLPIVLS